MGGQSWAWAAIALSLVSCDGHESAKTNSPATETVHFDDGDALSAEDQVAATGVDAIGGPAAAITVPATPEEQGFLADPACARDARCTGAQRFLAYVFQTYPDLKAIPFDPSGDIREDKNLFKVRRQSFYAGLYFAKRITLANGQTLFDFLTRCSKNVDPSTSADMVHGVIAGVDFSMQYLPTLREKASAGGAELQILLERSGDKVTATSPLFSTAALTSPRFMDDQGVACWRSQASPTTPAAAP